MIPGPTVVKKCSSCEGLIEQPTLVSGNTFGATIWSDGKQDAPMLPDSPSLVVCPHCESLEWIDELEKVGEFGWGEEVVEYPGSKPFKELKFKHYLSLLNKDGVDPEQLHYIRIRAWWSGNDFRRNESRTILMSKEEEDNLIALSEILDELVLNELLMKAEVMRELGRFDDAKSLLGKVSDPRYAAIVKAMRGLTDKEDRSVRRLE